MENVGRRPGQKEERWASSLVDAEDVEGPGGEDSGTVPRPPAAGARPSLRDDLRSELASLRSEVAQLRHELEELRQSLGG